MLFPACCCAPPCWLNAVMQSWPQATLQSCPETALGAKRQAHKFQVRYTGRIYYWLIKTELLTSISGKLILGGDSRKRFLSKSPKMPWKSVSPQNAYIETSTLNVMLFGGGDFGRWLGHKGGALLEEAYKETPESSLTFCQVRTQQKSAICEPGNWLFSRTRSAGARTFNLPASRTVRVHGGLS